MDLSIIIVNWNSVAFLRECLKNVYANTAGVRFEVVVVDNCSEESCQEMLRTTFPEVKFIQSDVNLGFSGANNLGAVQCTGRNLLFLNPDTEVAAEAIPRLLDCIDSVADAGIVGPRLLNSDLSVQTSCIQSFPSILNQTLDSEFLRRTFPKASLWGMGPLFAECGCRSAVDVIAGACLMIKADLFRSLGGFDTSYFMYAEDVDLCFRAKRQGWKSYYVPAASVVHHGGRSSDAQTDSHFAVVVMRESVMKFLRIRHGVLHCLAFRCFTAAAALARMTAMRTGIFIVREPKRGRYRAASKKWRKVLRWSLGRERWASELGGGKYA